MIIFTPLDLPKIEPDDWNEFWDIWDNHSDWLVKKVMNNQYSLSPIGNKMLWTGLDIYKHPARHPTYRAPFYDISKRLPKLYDFLENFNPNIWCARLIQSHVDIDSHTDDDKDIWGIRAMFHYTDNEPQWYFTKPFDSKGERSYISLPETTNWFSYNDKYSWHGTQFNHEHKKILLQIYTDGDTTSLIEQGIKKYTEYTINIGGEI